MNLDAASQGPALIADTPWSSPTQYTGVFQIGGPPLAHSPGISGISELPPEPSFVISICVY